MKRPTGLDETTDGAGPSVTVGGADTDSTMNSTAANPRTDSGPLLARWLRRRQTLDAKHVDTSA